LVHHAQQKPWLGVLPESQRSERNHARSRQRRFLSPGSGGHWTIRACATVVVHGLRCAALMRLPCVGPRVPGRARCTASRVTLTDAAGMVPVRLPSAPSMAWDALATAVRHALRVERRTDSAHARVRRHRKQRLDACAPLIAAWLPSILTSTEGVTFGPILLMGRPLMTCSIVVGCIPALQASFSAGQIATPSFKCPVAVL
jgi:hypothetical protein